MGESFKHFCDTIIKIDSSIRFVGIADGHRHILATTERPDLEPFLNSQETEQYAITAATRQYTRIRWQHILGKVSFTCSRYDKLLRSTIPITDGANRLLYALILTFDVDADSFHKITQKILPLVNNNLDNFLSFPKI